MSDPKSIADLLPAPRDLALFLDIDGTLIGPHHGDRGRGISPERLELLDRLSKTLEGALTILTGRAIEAVDRILSPLVLPAGGLQGSDRRFADGRRKMPVLTADERRMFEVIAEHVGRDHPGIEIEWKPAGMALVHDEEHPDADRLAELARSVVGKSFTVMPGRVAIDVVPVGVDKGHALDAFMERRPCVGRVPVHVGDDVPDEPAFRAAERGGGFGVTVIRPAAGVGHLLTDHEAVWATLEAYGRRFGV